MEVHVKKTKYINFDLVTFYLPSPVKYNSLNYDFVDCDCQVIKKVRNFKYLG